MAELFWQVFAAFIGGMVLNLTPCVLPVIPLKVRPMLQTGRQGSAPAVGMALSLLAGSLTVFGGLGLVTAWLNLQWGFLFQSRTFLLGLVVFLILAGALTLMRRPLPLPRGFYALAGHKTDPFLTGALAGVLSTPCTGPFLGSVLVFSITQPPSTILILFLAIGTGLATPYTLLLLWPGLLRQFPRGGAWTARIEELLGFILLAGGVFFLQSLVSPAWVQAAGYGLLAVFLGWASWHLLVPAAETKRASWLARSIPGLGLLAVLMVGWGYSGGLGQGARSLDWQTYSPVLVEKAYRQQRPVLIEFTADWCLNCKVLEKLVYNDLAVLTASRSQQLTTLRVDMTRPKPAQQQLLENLGGRGLPFAALFDRRGAIVTRFPDMFGADELVQAIRRAGNPDN